MGGAESASEGTASASKESFSGVKDGGVEGSVLWAIR